MREGFATAARGYYPGFGPTMEAAISINGSSLRQMGGTFIVDQQGRIQYTHIAKQVYEHASIDELLGILAGLPRAAAEALAAQP